MNRSSSFNLNPHAYLDRRPSISSRLSFAVSNAEQGENDVGAARGESIIREEIAEIKKYEVSHPI